MRAEQEARLLDLLGKLSVIFDNAVPAVNAFFTDLRRDTEQLREWSTTVGQAKGGPSKVKDPEMSMGQASAFKCSASWARLFNVRTGRKSSTNGSAACSPRVNGA